MSRATGNSVLQDHLRDCADDWSARKDCLPPREEVRRIHPLAPACPWSKFNLMGVDSSEHLGCAYRGSVACPILVTTGNPGQEARSTWCRYENRRCIWLLYCKMVPSLGGEGTSPVSQRIFQGVGSSKSEKVWLDKKVNGANDSC